MFARQAARSMRSLPLSSTSRRLLSTQSGSSSSSSFNRNLVIGLSTFAISALALTSERRRVLNDDKVRESVLDQDTLKRPIHKREGQTPQPTTVWNENAKVLSGEPRTQLPNESLSSTSSSSSSATSTPTQAQDQSSSTGFSSDGPPKTKAQTQPPTIADKVTEVIQEKVVPRTPDVTQSVLDQPSLKAPVHKRETATKAAESTPAPGSSDAAHLIEDKSSEAANPSQGAFNEETGEINWDCPCLGGMADGPCGEDFKAAFSCFIYSEAEPKGVDCVEKFKAMQDCFRLHPEIYGEEIDDDEQPLDAPNPAAEGISIKEEANKVPS
ncbi:hypothetical protein I317_03472 [Kwoniella heveanensis CBS 569]|nr:hypothetical protein I317_03472 [Kwoniella heveanensis CBS 569]